MFDKPNKTVKSLRVDVELVVDDILLGIPGLGQLRVFCSVDNVVLRHVIIARTDGSTGVC